MTVCLMGTLSAISGTERGQGPCLRGAHSWARQLGVVLGRKGVPGELTSSNPVFPKSPESKDGDSGRPAGAQGAGTQQRAHSSAHWELGKKRDHQRVRNKVAGSTPTAHHTQEDRASGVDSVFNVLFDSPRYPTPVLLPPQMAREASPPLF